jgi:hypothetical protein
MRAQVTALTLVLLLTGSPLGGTDEFYAAPRRLGRYTPGEIIKSERVHGLVRALHGCSATRIMYRSRDPQGGPSRSRG